jgi:cation/acetate symporter
VTWTQVAQYIILIVAYMIPVVWLSVKQTGVPIPQAAYGSAAEKVTALEKPSSTTRTPKGRKSVARHLQARRRRRRQAEGLDGRLPRRREGRS